MRKISLLIVVLIVSTSVFAQIKEPVKWSYAARRLNATEAVVVIKATIDKGWHIYSQKPYKGFGPSNTVFTFNPSKNYTLTGKTSEPAPISVYEKAFKMDVFYFEKEVVFQQKVKLKSAAGTTVTGKFEYMVCNDHECLPPEEVPFSIPVKAAGK